MTTAERVHAIVDYGFTERQSRFLVLVMRHSGLCIKRQYGAFAGVARSVVENVQPPGALPILGAAAVLVCAGVLASLMPAARASHVDVMQALRSE